MSFKGKNAARKIAADRVRTSLARVAVASILLALVHGCRERKEPPPQPEEVSIWHQVGTWKGRGNMQTETFTGDTGAFRVTWETRNETAPGKGRLYAVFRSGDSGREIMDAVRASGTGRGVAYPAAERPRWYYLTIESENVDWSITVEEEIPGVVRPKESTP